MGALQPVHDAAPIVAADVEKVLIGGDLSKLSPEQRISYYNAVCKSLNLNPLTKPFAYLTLSGKTVLYAQKDCTEQLRNLHSISLSIPAREVIDGVYVVTSRATRPDGRADEATGAVAIEGLKGEARANAMMKAETKAKRRVTLSICGLGMLDESEVDSIPGAQREDIDTGGHTVGTKAAQDYVRDQKIAKQDTPTNDKGERTAVSEPAQISASGDARQAPPFTGSGIPEVDELWARMGSRRDDIIDVLAELHSDLAEIAGTEKAREEFQRIEIQYAGGIGNTTKKVGFARRVVLEMYKLLRSYKSKASPDIVGESQRELVQMPKGSEVYAD
ncbi:MAG TPA: hypothetical protein VKX49_26105 [Bryobacteraceae bacterium]|nr:hypothetical protein [Bryobacteraceae bacterium]